VAIESDWIETGFLGDDPSIALDALEVAINSHALPFLRDWWHNLNQLPTAEEVEGFRNAITARSKSKPLPAAYAKLPDLLKELAIAMRMNRRNFVNIHPSPFLPSALASLIVSLQNPNNIVEEVSEATSRLERESIAWMAEHLIGNPPGGSPMWGNVVSGGTVANITAMLVARDYTYDKLARPRRAFVGARGITGLKSGVVLGTAATHYSLEKALWFLGLGSENLIRVPVCFDEALQKANYHESRFVKGIRHAPWKGQINEAIERDRKRGLEELNNFYSGKQSPFGLQPLESEVLKTLYSCFEFSVPLIACVLTLGTTDTGTIERIDSGAMELLVDEDIFIHGDAASGGFALLSEHVKPLMNKPEYIDSFTIDPHKVGLLHYPCGAVLFRDQGFKDQIAQEAPYLGPLAPTLEGSRPGTSSAALWLATQTIGVNGYKKAVNTFINFAKQLAKSLADSQKFQVLHEVHLNALGIAPLPKKSETRRDVNALVAAIHDKITVRGSPFLINFDKRLADVKVSNNHKPGDTDVVDIQALRIVITNPLVQDKDATELTKLLVRFLDEARKERGTAATNVAFDQRAAGFKSDQLGDPRLRRRIAQETHQGPYAKYSEEPD
jgi:glutamate/tyrosine decarboxylase-like PLP-dependent enzyme